MDVVKKQVVLEGITPIMFDRYSGSNDIALSPEDKMYFGRDGKTLVMPSVNIASFLGSEKNGAAKLLLESKVYKKVSGWLMASTMIRPTDVPFLRNGKPIKFGKFDKKGTDSGSHVYLRSDTARLKDNIPNPKVRPVLPTPWLLSFELDIIESKDVKEILVRDIFERGGMYVGLGTFRRFFGKFIIKKWE